MGQEEMAGGRGCYSTSLAQGKRVPAGLRIGVSYVPPAVRPLQLVREGASRSTSRGRTAARGDYLGAGPTRMASHTADLWAIGAAGQKANYLVQYGP